MRHMELYIVREKKNHVKPKENLVSDHAQSTFIETSSFHL